MQRTAALIVCLALCSFLLPAHSLSESASRFPCGHVCGDGNCSYHGADSGVPCDHVHNDDCGYSAGSPCADTHIHDDACGYDAETGVGCTYAHEHDDACGYAPASPCTHACGDGTCAYKASQQTVSCDHICEILGFDGYSAGTPINTATASLGDTEAQIAAVLPTTLKGAVACAPGALVDIRVTWGCANYDSATPGIYRFIASLDPAVASYTVEDDPATQDIDESVTSPYCDMPFIEVTVADETSAIDPPEAPPIPVRGHVCEIASFTDYELGRVLAVAEFDKGRTVEELYTEVLPTSLAVTYACACSEIEGELPVTWTCNNFDPNATGDYLFTVCALPDYPFTYLPQDDPATIETDESWLPSILVRVYEPTAPTEKFTVCYGVINAENVHVRSGPGTIFESLAQFGANTPVTVTGQCDHWYRVNVAKWEGAFIDKSLITILEEQTGEAPPMTAKLNADDVKVRKGPDREYDIIRVLPLGAPMTILGRCGNWYYISTEDIPEGYIWREYVTVDPPIPVEEPVCSCTAHCDIDAPNTECPVCAEYPEDCTVRYIGEGFPKDGIVHTDNCEILVGSSTLHLHIDTPITLYNETDGRYEFSSEEIAKGFISIEFVDIIEYVCTCTAPCSEKICNALCPVCAKEGFVACGQQILSEQTISAKAEDGTLVTISGILPADAAVSVALVANEAAKEFVAKGAELLYAYDIKILVCGVEWQPSEAVHVTIAPVDPIQAPVAVTHIAEDKNTGGKTPTPVAGVVTTDAGEVAFAADGFSVYLVLD